MSTKLQRITQGNTGTLYKVGVEGNPALTPDYTCVLSVPSAVPPISRPVTIIIENDTRFAVQLTPAETATLANNQSHVMAVQVTNTTTTPVFIVETPIEFWVAPQLI